GTSVGALNAAAYSFVGLEKLVETWMGLKGTSDIYAPKDDLGLPVNEMADLFLGGGCGIYSSKPLQNLIEKLITGKPSLPVTVCRVSLCTSEKQFISATPSKPNLPLFQKAVLSSASVPILVDLVDDEWGDGGLRDITPVRKAFSDGCLEVTVVLCDPYQQNMDLGGKVGNVIDTITRTVTCTVQQVFWDDIQDAVHTPGVGLTVYAPPKPLGDSTKFDPALIRQWMALGEQAKPVYRK
ncbi:MAG TPA: hypothetical protein VJ873_13505, partial [bacterium]|nr:hypothetical protein [bacterium]